MREDNKRVLFVVGIEQELDYEYIKQKYNIPPEEIHILESDELNRIEPFGDLMKDILLQVYQKNMEEIVIVEAEEERKNIEGILRYIGKNIDLKENLNTVNYLFSHCNPEFPEETIGEWLDGNNRFIGNIQNTMEVIRRHPLMPDSVKVTQLRLGQEKVKQLEFDVF